MNRTNRRHEPSPRFGLQQNCRGVGSLNGSGARIYYRGVDVSTHGLGVVIVGPVNSRDTLTLDIGGLIISFEVMWVESYLGIDHNYRVGLQCLDRMLDLRAKLNTFGFVTVALDEHSAA